MPNELNKLRVGHVLRPYYYGSHKWEDYLVDIQETIAGLSLDQVADTQIQFALETGFDDVNANLEDISAGIDGINENLEDISAGIDDVNANLRGVRTGIADINANLRNISSGIEDLRADFQWGFTLMIARQEKQIQLLNSIIRGLDAIQGVLELPLTTKTRELFALGQNDHQAGFLPEALEKFLAAEQLNKVNFPLQLQIGKLFLYGKSRQDNVIDLPKAEEHLLLAARYAGVEAEWAKCRGEALFHAAIAAYLIGEQLKTAGHLDASRGYLGRALLHLRSAINFWPTFTESYYLGAKCHALLGQREEALANLEILSDRDRRYFAKMSKDKDLDPIRAEAERVFHNSVANPGPQARAAKVKLSEIGEELGFFEGAAPKRGKELAFVTPTKALLKRTAVSLFGLDANVEGILSRLLSAQRSLREASKDIVINCDNTPRPRIRGGNHFILSQNQLPKAVRGILWWDPTRVELSRGFSGPRYQFYPNIAGASDRLCQLHAELGDQQVLNANVLDRLLAHPHLIPEDWRNKLLDGVSETDESCWGAILFLGTIYINVENDGLLVRALSLSRSKNREWEWTESEYDMPRRSEPRLDSNNYHYYFSETHYVAQLA